MLTPEAKKLAGTGIAVAAALSCQLAYADITLGIGAPVTGKLSWAGGYTIDGATLAIEDINAAGGVLGEPIDYQIVDDFCDGEQAIAAARLVVERDIDGVVGHQCSAAAIPASEIYEAAGIVFISNYATNPQLTERGLRNVFRVIGRDDVQGAIGARRIANYFPSRPLAVVNDDDLYSRGVAKELISALSDFRIEPVVTAEIAADSAVFDELLARLEQEKVGTLYYAGFAGPATLLLREAKLRLPDLQILMPDAASSFDLALFLGPAVVGLEFTNAADVSVYSPAQGVVERLAARGASAEGTTLQSYAAVQIWAAAANAAGTIEDEAMRSVLTSTTFDTVIGPVRFNEKGDLAGVETFQWFVWQDEKSFVPLR